MDNYKEKERKGGKKRKHESTPFPPNLNHHISHLVTVGLEFLSALRRCSLASASVSG